MNSNEHAGDGGVERDGRTVLTRREIHTRYGRMIVPDPDQDIVARFLLEQGEWAELETEFLRELIEDGARIADIGAFVGTFGLSMQAKKKLASICFVEANPEIFPLLRENVENNCRVDHAAVEAIVSPQDFRANGSRDHHNIGSASFLPGNLDPGRVEVRLPDRRCTLWQLEQEHGPFDLIKLDVEGMELAILADAPEIVKRENAVLWMECNEHERSLELTDFLLSQDRRVYYFAFPSFNPDNFCASTEPIFPFAYEAGLLACSTEPKLAATLIAKGCLLRPISSREDLANALLHTPRWAPEEWWGLPREQVVALAVHQIDQRATALREHEATLAQSENLLTELRSDIAQRDAALGQSEKLLTELRSGIAQRDAALGQSEKLLTELRSDIAKRDAALRQREAMLDDVQARLAERRSYIITRESELRVVEQARRRAEALAAERHVAMETERIAREAIEHTAHNRLALLQAERELRMQAVREHEAAVAAITAITASTTWRVTAPLRALLSRVPGARRMIRGMARVAGRVLPRRR